MIVGGIGIIYVNMRAITGILLFALCVAIGVSQITEPATNRCWLGALVRFGLTDPTCAEELRLGINVSLFKLPPSWWQFEKCVMVVHL